MKKLKKVLCLILAVTLLFGGAPMGVKEVCAANNLPNELYLKQNQSGTCTLCSAAMMLRSRAYLNGNENWKSITENGIRSSAWMEGIGLYWSWSYSIGDCSFKVNRSALSSGVSISGLKTILDAHPEGIVLYCGGVPHAVFLTDYEGDTFYCADTTNSYAGGRIPLSSSYLASKLGGQTNILKNVTAYWYIESYNVPSHSVEPTGLPFNDIYKNDWYFDAVAYVYYNGIMTGMSESVFGPTKSLSRAQFAVMLYRLEGSPEVGYSQAFSDVGQGTWYTNAILWANAKGIITGYGDGSFGITDDITREQLATILYRYAKYEGLDVSVSSSLDNYIDHSHVSAFAKDAMGWAVGNRIVTGKDNGTRLAPLETAARAECAVIITRFMNQF